MGTTAQQIRQQARRRGRYSDLPKCEVCNRGVADYESLPYAESGRGLVLCHRARCLTEAGRRWPIAQERARFLEGNPAARAAAEHSLAQAERRLAALPPNASGYARIAASASLGFWREYLGRTAANTLGQEG